MGERLIIFYITSRVPDSKLRFIHTTSKLKHYFHTKVPQCHLRRSNVVYCLNCSCGSFCIGQARRNLIKRLQEHQTSDTSEVCNHIQSNTHYKVDFNNPQILTHSPDKYKLLILEFIFIQQLKPNPHLDSAVHILSTPSIQYVFCISGLKYSILNFKYAFCILINTKYIPSLRRRLMKIFSTEFEPI